MQVNVSSRATAAVHLDAAVCRLAGAGCRMLGVVPIDEALDGLADGGATLLSSCPSYLGEMVVGPASAGMGPNDFTLRRIDVGGEVLSPSLAAAARETFGVTKINDSFGMTEVMPVSGTHLQSRPPAPRHQHGPGRVARPRDRRAGRSRARWPPW